MNWKLNRDTLAPWVATILLFGSWEAMVWVTGVDESVLPAPSAVINALFEFWGPIWMHTQQTLYTTLVGFAIAIVFGMGLGLVTGASPLLYRAIYPLLIGFNAIPKVAIVAATACEHQTQPGDRTHTLVCPHCDWLPAGWVVSPASSR